MGGVSIGDGVVYCNSDVHKVHVKLEEVTFNLKTWDPVKKELKQDYGVVSLAEAYRIFADFCEKYPNAELDEELGAFEICEGNIRVSDDRIETRLRLTATMPFTVNY